MDKEIFQTKNFIVRSAEKPDISRTDGGHIKIVPKVKVVDRTQLTPELAIELMRLTMVVGEAMTKALNQRGIDIGRINYQDNGNWGVFQPEGPHLHIHLYGRAKSAKIQKWGDACYFPQIDTGFYDSFEPLNDNDIEEIKKEIELILKKEKYQDQYWHL
ncbi:MAG: HIT domain-containing protein [Candidatus Paceibacterota bacterium]|jgi:diadenosine tetraphosphate (Ap4A) HIT family hydrolase